MKSVVTESAQIRVIRGLINIRQDAGSIKDVARGYAQHLGGTQPQATLNWLVRLPGICTLLSQTP